MNILERAQAFVESLSEQASRGARGWQRRIHCGSRATIKNGSYRRRPWGEEGRGERRMQRHLCRHCGRSYSEQAPELVARSWYTRAAQRKVIDQCLPLGSSLRRTVAWLRSEMGKQARWRQGHPLAEGRCRLSVCTAERWLARAGLAAAESVVGQLAGIACSGEMATDGLWARLRQGAKRVVLRLADGVSGLIYPPVVAPDEERAARWEALFARAQAAGLSLAAINGLVSDGAHGLRSYLRQALPWVPQQRCVPQLPLGRHLWRNRGGRIAQQVKAAIAGLEGEAAQTLAEPVRDGLGQASRAIRDAASYEEAERALGPLRLMPWGEPLAAWLEPLLDAARMHLLPCHQGLLRVTPEWLWRDLRLRLSHGRNHGSERRLERALLLWAIYHHFTPAQRGKEKKRPYRHPGQSPPEVAGAPPGRLSYLDALGV